MKAVALWEYKINDEDIVKVMYAEFIYRNPKNCNCLEKWPQGVVRKEKYSNWAPGKYPIE